MDPKQVGAGPAAAPLGAQGPQVQPVQPVTARLPALPQLQNPKEQSYVGEAPWDTVGRVLFGKDTGEGLGGVPVLGDFGRWLGEAGREGGAGVGAVIGGAADVLGRVPMSEPDYGLGVVGATGIDGLHPKYDPNTHGFMGAVNLINDLNADNRPGTSLNLADKFLQLGRWQKVYDPEGFKAWEEAQKKAQESTGVGSHAGDIIQNYLRQWAVAYYDLTPNGVEGMLDIAPELAFFGGGNSMGQTFADGLSLIMVPQRMAERGAAYGWGRKGGLMDLESTGYDVPNMGRRVNELLYLADYDPRSLTDVEAAVVDGLRNKGWSPKHAYNYLVSHGQGFSSDSASQVAVGFATDPLMVSGATAAMGSMVAAKVAAGTYGRTSANVLGRIAARGGVSAPRMAAMYRGVAKSIGTTVAEVQASPLGPSLKVARTIVDPFSALGKGSEAAAKANVLAAAGIEGTRRGFGAGAVTAALRRAQRWGAKEVFDTTFGQSAMNFARKWVGGEVVDGLLRQGEVSTRHIISEEALQFAAETAPKDAASRLADFVMRHREFWLTDLGQEQLAERISKITGQALDVTTAAVKSMSRDEQAVWHSMSYSGAWDDFKTAIGRVPVDEWGTLARKIEDLVILNPHEMDSLAAQDLLKAIQEAKHTKDAADIWNKAAGKWDMIANLGRVNIVGKKTMAAKEAALERIIKEGFLHTSLGADEMKHLPKSFVDEFLGKWTGADGKPIWRLGFKPTAANSTGLMFDEAGELVARWAPAIENVTTAIPVARGGTGPITDALGRILPTTRVGRAAQGMRDTLDVALSNAVDNISGQRMMLSMEQKFRRLMRSNGYSDKLARDVFRVNREYASGHGWTLAGHTSDDFWKASQAVLKGEVDVRIAKRDIYAMLAESAGGDLRLLGLSSGMTQRIRSGLIAAGLDPNNYVGVVSVKLYNILRYVLNPTFFFQAQFDAPFFNLYRGVPIDLWGSKAKPGSTIWEMQRITKAMSTTGMFRDLSADFTERSMTVGFAHAIQTSMEGLPGVKEGLASRVAGRLGRSILNNEMLYMNSRIGDVVEDALKQARKFAEERAAEAATTAERDAWLAARVDVAPMLDFLKEDFKRVHGYIPSGEELGRWYLSDLIDDSRMATMTDEGMASYLKVMSKGEYVRPTSIADLRALDLDYGAESLSLPNVHNAAGLRVALAEGRVTVGEIEERMLMNGLHSDHIKRFTRAIQFNWRRYFNDLRSTLGMTPFEMRGVEDMVAKAARRAGMSPTEYITQVLPMTGRSSTDAADVAARVSKAHAWVPRAPVAAPADMFDYTVANGGGTFDVATGAALKPSKGYAVGMGQRGRVVANDRAAIEQAYADVSRTGTPNIGTWIDPDTGMVSVDPSDIIVSRKEAIALAQARGEKAIWDFAKQTDVPIAAPVDALGEDMAFMLKVMRAAEKGEAGMDDLTRLVASNLQPSMKQRLLDHFIEDLGGPNGEIAKATAAGDLVRAKALRETMEDLKGGWGKGADERFRDLVVARAGGRAGVPPVPSIRFARDAKGNAVVPDLFTHETPPPGVAGEYVYRVEKPGQGYWPENTGVTTGAPTTYYVKTGDETIFRAAMTPDELATGRHGPGGVDRLTKTQVEVDRIEYLGGDGAWHPVTDVIPEPEVERAARYFSQYLRDLGPQIQAGEVAKAIVNNIPIEGASPYDMTQTILLNTLYGNFRLAEKDAIRLAYMSTERTGLGRTLNHPFFALYPTSYFWGKVIPETFRFIAYEPVGLRTTLGLEAYLKMQQTVALQSQYDDRMGELWETLGKSPTLSLLSYLSPGMPWEEMRTSLPPWVREMERSGNLPLAIQKQFDMMDVSRWYNRWAESAEEIVGGVEDTLAPPEAAAPSIFEQMGQMNAGAPPVESAKPPPPGGPVKGTGLAPILSGELAELERVLSGE